MQILRICGVGVIAAVSAVVIKQIRADAAVPVRVAVNIILFGAALSLASPVYYYINDMIASSALSEFGSILMKALGIALATHICSEICRDAGEASIAGCIEMAGKCEILLLSLPLITSIINTASDVLGWGT